MSRTTDPVPSGGSSSTDTGGREKANGFCKIEVKCMFVRVDQGSAYNSDHSLFQLMSSITTLGTYGMQYNCFFSCCHHAYIPLRMYFTNLRDFQGVNAVPRLLLQPEQKLGSFYFTWEVPKAETPWFVMFQFVLYFVCDTFLPQVYNYLRILIYVDND
jgi:hypothetical protein